jgi:predicted nucleotidyltransferase
MRFTEKKLMAHVKGFLNELKSQGYSFEKILLFGSYANGYPHELSDIDLAIWSEQFSEDPYESREKIRSILQTYSPIQLHPYTPGESALTDPFINEIERTGKEIFTEEWLNLQHDNK